MPLLVLPLLLLWLLSGCADGFPLQTTGLVDAAASPVSAAVPTIAATSVPLPVEGAVPVESYLGVPVGFTAEGYPYRGDPNAPIVVYEFSDYQCPFCARHAIETEPALTEQFVRSGQVQFVFREFPLVQLHPNAPAVHTAALCVAEQGIVGFWRLHDQLFRTQSQWANLPDPGPFLADLAAQVGAEMEGYSLCVSSGKMDAVIDQGLADGQAAGVSGTPSFQFVRRGTDESYTLVGAQPYEIFADWIGSLVAGQAPGAPQAQQQAPQPGIPFWATAEGLAPDPARPGHTVAGDQYRGNSADPQLVVIEFSDFECPFCQRHYQQTQPVLDERFVDTGQVLWVFKHFPLDIHPHAPLAGAAAECAADQGQFWEMHHLLFDNIQLWANNSAVEGLQSLAEQLGLEMETFSSCLQGEDAARRVLSDLSDGASYVRGTPTFIVLQEERGRIIPGALPADQFVSALESMLEEGDAGN